jgi:hypothetical protein
MAWVRGEIGEGGMGTGSRRKSRVLPWIMCILFWSMMRHFWFVVLPLFRKTALILEPIGDALITPRINK